MWNPAIIIKNKKDNHECALLTATKEKAEARLWCMNVHGMSPSVKLPVISLEEPVSQAIFHPKGTHLAISHGSCVTLIQLRDVTRRDLRAEGEVVKMKEFC